MARSCAWTSPALLLWARTAGCVGAGGWPSDEEIATTEEPLILELQGGAAAFFRPAGGIPFVLGGNFAPGVGSLAVGGGFLYFGSTCKGGVRRVPIASGCASALGARG